MRRKRSILLPVLLAASLAAGEVCVRVTADHANLRFQNADNVDVACVLSAGQELLAFGPLEGNWVPVAPPEDVSVWIYAELVRKGSVARDKTQIRSGPGLNYKVVGSVDHGTLVESRGRLGDWLKIRPPAGFPLWISRSAIALAPTSAPPNILPLPPNVANGLLTALAADTAVTSAVVATVAPAWLPSPSTTGSFVRPPPPPELVERPLSATPLQGRRLRFTGALRASVAGATASQALYRISGRDSAGGVVTFCHVLGPLAQLDAIPAGAQVTIEGPAWWLEGESVPVVKAENVIVLHPLP